MMAMIAILDEIYRRKCSFLFGLRKRNSDTRLNTYSRWRHQMETFSALLALCVRGIHRSLVNFPHNGRWRGALMFSLICAINKRFSKQSRGWWFETPSHSLWCHCNVNPQLIYVPCIIVYIYCSFAWIKNYMQMERWYAKNVENRS